MDDNFSTRQHHRHSSVHDSFRNRMSPVDAALSIEATSECPVTMEEIDQFRNPDETAKDGSDDVFKKPFWSSLLLSYCTQSTTPVNSSFNLFVAAAKNRRPFSLINSESHGKPFSYWDEYLERERSLMHGKGVSPSEEVLIGGEPLSCVASTPLHSHHGTVTNGYSSGYKNLYTQSSVPQYMRNRQGKMGSMAQKKGGSRFVMDVLQRVSNEYEVEIVLSEVLWDIGMLMQSSHGSRVAKKLITLCSKHQITSVLLALIHPRQLENACLTRQGAYVVMELLSHVDHDDLTQITVAMNLLISNAVTLSKSLNGHDVIQYCLEHLPEEFSERFVSDLAENCEEVATDPHAYRILIRFVNYARDLVKDFLLTRIILNAVHFSINPWGNFVVQDIFCRQIPGLTEAVLQQLQGSFADLSVNKFGSNVVEKCLVYSNEYQVDTIVAELLAIPDLTEISEDPFGNYVLQKALQVSKGQTRRALIDAIEMNSASMRRNMYGKKVLGEAKRFRKKLRDCN